MIGILTAGWCSGSTELKQILSQSACLWEEPYGHSGLFDGLFHPNLSLTERWPDNESGPEVPSLERLQSAQKAWFDELLHKPAQKKGKSVWGFTEVRLSARHAEWIRWLYPDAKLIFVVRNPYDAFRQFVAERKLDRKTYRRWPNEPVTAHLFGSHWRELTTGFQANFERLGAKLIRYEELSTRGKRKEIEEYLQLSLGPWPVQPEEHVGSSGTKPSGYEMDSLRRQVEPLASEMGYRDRFAESFGIPIQTGSPVAPREKCVILVPIGSSIEPGCEEALQELERRGYKVWRVRGYSAIDQGRNQMATDALAAGFEETLWIDSDVAFHPDDVDRLRAHPHPLLCAIYPKKGKRELAAHVLPGTGRLVFGKRGSLTELKYAATGFLLVRRVVYETIKEQLNLPVCNLQFGNAMVPYFQPLVTDSTVTNPALATNEPGVVPWYLAEDFAFCERARRCGFRILADTSIRLFHVGSYPYSWEEAGHEIRRYETFEFRLTESPKGPPSTSDEPTTGNSSASPAAGSHRPLNPAALAALRQAFPWPSERPIRDESPIAARPPDNLQRILKRSLSRNMEVILQLGADDGDRTEPLLDLAPIATLIACDPWQTKAVHETFLMRLWDSHDRVIPVPLSNRNAIRRVAALGITPGAVLWEGDRDFDGVRGDLVLLAETWPSVPIIGEDFDWPGVETAVSEVAKSRRRTLKLDESIWLLQ